MHTQVCALSSKAVPRWEHRLGTPTSVGTFMHTKVCAPSESGAPTGSAGFSQHTTRNADFSRHNMHTQACAPRNDQEFLGWHFRGYLPHVDAPDLYQFVTFRLCDALPRTLLRQWRQELRSLSPKRRQQILQQRIAESEDRGYGHCYLAIPAIAQMLQEELLREDNLKYHLKAWCIMPNHVHVLVQTSNASLSAIIRQWKGRSALRANRYLQRKGNFWAKEYFDRYIRNQKHYAAVVQYIRDNPVRAGLVKKPEQWRWSYWNEDEIRM